MRRQTGEALGALIDAERIAPEQTRAHPLRRAMARDSWSSCRRSSKPGHVRSLKTRPPWLLVIVPCSRCGGRGACRSRCCGAGTCCL
jgi:hypothetical protein